MAWKKTVLLKDGRKVLLRDLSPKDSASEFRNFIGSFVKEGAFLLRDEVPSVKEEREWLKKTTAEIAKKERIKIIAESCGRVVGTVDAWKLRYKERNNTLIGIAIVREFRGVGLGKIMLNEIIARIKHEFKPKNIVLSVFAPNKRAHALYKKVGFTEFARFPNWLKHKGKYYDKIHLILK